MPYSLLRPVLRSFILYDERHRGELRPHDEQLGVRWPRMDDLVLLPHVLLGGEGVQLGHGERSRSQLLLKSIVGRAPEMDGRTSPDTSRATGAALADEGAKGVMLVDSPPHQPQKTVAV